jgi:hypothetical protein
MDTLEKAHHLSNELIPYIGSMRVGLSTHGDEMTAVRVSGEAIVCHSRKELELILDAMLLILKAIKPNSEQNPERSVARNDDSSTKADNQIKQNPFGG